MAPHIQPKTLYALSLSYIRDSIGRACEKIYFQYGSYDHPESSKQVLCLQNYLFSSLPGMVIEKLCEETRFSSFHVSIDLRIKLGVYMHPLMKKFNFLRRSQVGFKDLDEFWLQKIPTLTRLVVLNLYHVATDEIIEEVSKNCPLLEEINIVSKVENGSNSGNQNFNAMKLKFFVSDVGLNHLVKCKRLKIIITNKTIRSNCAGRMMTHNGFRALLKGLPHLEMVRYGDLGSVISTGMDDVEELPLTYISDNHPNICHIEVTSKLCPHLKHLSLSLPHQERQLDADIASEDIARSLAQSGLNPSILELQHFSFNAEIANMFVLKGIHLSSLFLCSMNVITSKEVIIIGQNCPNLKNVHIKGLGTETTLGSFSRSFSQPGPMYRNLKCLYVTGKAWDVEYILKLFLTYALELTGLNIWIETPSPEADKALNKVISHLSFNELKSADFCYGCGLSPESVRNLIYRCPKLTDVTVWEHEGLPQDEIENIQREATSRNFDVELQPLVIK